ncbi:hypothetical protein GPJ56_009289 [Histomonas meleagridis]|uniref:uncharacterized protein n=1 Tax=Histomonas meleagridis TaxID=135588 RepID=UPI00355A06B6|nr:hypothetical protein GPJ56_009289 [Histomonas meleagridis]KAH0797702.1 hypothetical protein GO595_009331 [Histomonas meleagridis]
MTLTSYNSEKFGDFNVSKGSIISSCLPTAETLTKSNTFSPSYTFIKSNAFTESNVFTGSNTFTQTLPNGGEYSLVISYTEFMSYTQTISVSNYSLRTHSMTLYGSSPTYVITENIYYEYIIVHYTTYYSYYMEFYTIIYSFSTSKNTISTGALVGIICGSCIFVFLIIAIVIFLLKSNKKKPNSSVKLEFKDSTNSETPLVEEVIKDIEDLAKEDEDQWI